ncbi:MAG: sigma-70 family RNA polymerase sigma factor [Dehalococcoidales bacterium]|nr:sigma-70 family RNA polymerase sigma factor [Dehalococcoidales bacterium]
MAQPQTADTETSLIEQAQNGDRNAFGELVRRHYQGVVLVVYRMCGDTGLAEDAAQEAFMRAWVNLPSYQPQARLRNWLYRIAVNAALDVLRRKPEETLEDEQARMVTDQAAGPETALIEKERVALLQQAMKSLPEAARSVLVLREYGGLSYQEIASVLDVPVGTVMSRLNYARNRLREILRSYTAKTESEYA